MPGLAQASQGCRRSRRLGVDGGVQRKTMRREGAWGCRGGSRAAKGEAVGEGTFGVGCPAVDPEVRDLGMEHRAVLVVPSVCSADIRLDVAGGALSVSLLGPCGESRPLCQISIPDGVEEDYITAEVAGVILTVVMPKAVPRRVRMADPEDGAGWGPLAPDGRAGMIGDWLVEVGVNGYRLLRPIPPACWGPKGVQVVLMGSRVAVCGEGGEALDGFRAPEDVDQEGVFASVAGGLLVVVMPRRGAEGPEG
ncbi:unnamed protein product [Ostreobium quekettii]|uniref:SHSP domain-containing protein n=1 Tax=Ostreobium quekettii TaxID=121088 RepID=A0A8S1ITM4_9CHLO|nr:unnamed protein product [Ostreobium quekettii]